MEKISELHNPTKNLSVFFERIYGSQRGYAYAPTKEVGGSQKWTKHFFKWPQQKEQLVEHVLTSTSSHEIYFSPALYRNAAYFPQQITPELWKGSYYVWAEFDYGTPSSKLLAELNIPEPSIKIRTSSKSNEHWYWRLSEFETDKEKLEDITRKLAYHLNADLSGWDYQQVLRPPGTIHHDSQKSTSLLVIADSNYNISLFKDLEPPTFAPRTDVRLGLIPDAMDVIFKYTYSADFTELFRKKVDELNIKEGATKPDRSGALMRIGFATAEMGMVDEEIYSMLRHADERWQKFTTVAKLSDADKEITDKPDPERQKKHLLRILNRARLKYPLKQADDLSEFLPLFGFKSLIAADVHIEWVIEGLLQKNGFLVISGPPDSGKTQLSLWIAMHLALGLPVFGWKAENPLKILFISCEMPHADIKKIMEQMGQNFTAEQHNMLEENLIVSPLGSSVHLDKASGRKKLFAAMDIVKPEGLMIDSLGVSIGDDIKSDVVIKDTFDVVNTEIRKKRECFVWFIHHGRKGQVGNKQPKELDDLYGSMYIGAQATTVLGVWPIIKGKTIELNYLKTRMTPAVDNPRITRTTPLGFKLDSDPEETILSPLVNFANRNKPATSIEVEDDDSFDLE